MKIFEIGTGYTPIPAQMGAATEIVVEELTRAFLQRGESVQIIDIAAEDRSSTALPILEVPVPRCFRGTDIKLGVMHKLKRVVYSICLARVLQKILKQTEEKVVLHFHNQYNLFFFLKLTSEKLRRKAVIAYTNHSGIWSKNWTEISAIIKKRYFQEAECMRRADIVFLLNEKTRKNVIEHIGVSEDRIALINNGVNTAVYYPIPNQEKQTIKESHGFRDCHVILQVGSVNENKGQMRILQWLLPVLNRNPNVVYACAGGIVDQGYFAKIQQFLQDQHLQAQVRYLGMIAPGEKLNDIYNCADVTIVSSGFESFSLVALESMAAGVPVVLDSSIIPWVKEGVIPLNYENTTELEAFLFGDTTNRENLCRLARRFATCNFSWSSISSDYLSEFQNGMRNND